MRAEEKRTALRLKQAECAQILDVRYRNGHIQCLVLWRVANGRVSEVPVWGDYAETRNSESFAKCLAALCEESQLKAKWESLLDVEFPEDKEEEEIPSFSPVEIIDRELPQFDELEFHCYCILYARALETGFVGPNFLESFMDKRRVARYHRKRQRQLLNLASLSRRITDLAGVSVTFENRLDFEEPAQFKYVSECFSHDVKIPDDPIIGCECRSCTIHRKDCCPTLSGNTPFPYKKDGTLTLVQGKAIYECNSRCRCDENCQNRVVQKGPTVPFIVFKTPNRGWGLKTMVELKAGQFVCEYVGEVIDCSTADARGKNYDNIGLTYLFDLDYNNAERPYTIDAYEYGSIARFMNHSCDPNCAIWACYINCLDPNLPRLAIFTRRRMEAGEELTFDYNVGSGAMDGLNDSAEGSGKVSQIGQCYCKSKKCRSYLFDAAV